MFDKDFAIYSTSNYYGPSKIEVTEKRAPTDESVKLLKEFEEKAIEKIVSSTRVQDNDFEYMVHSAKDYMNSGYKFMIVYSLNGNKRKIDYEYNPRYDINPSEAVAGVVKTLSEDIASNILKNTNWMKDIR